MEILGHNSAFIGNHASNPCKAISYHPIGCWAIAFVYGVIHMVGPGHGKTIVDSYFVSRPGKIKQGFLMGNILTFVHVGPATAVVMAVFLILQSKNIAEFEKVSPILERISYAIIVGIGVIIFVQTLRRLLKNEDPKEESIEKPGLSTMIAIAVAAGIVLCPGAAIILGILGPGLVAMFFLALGMGITTTLFALTAITARKTALHIADRSKRAARLAHAGLSMLGALLVVILGGLLYLSV